MAKKKEILLYGALYDWTAEYIVREINMFDDMDDLTMRMDTPGAYVLKGNVILSKLADRKGGIQFFVDGQAASMGAFMLLYGQNNVGSEESIYVFHKAAFEPWYEPTEDDQKELKALNARMKARMEARLFDNAKTKALIKKVFEPDVRNNVKLSATEALEIGLITEIKPLDLNAKAQMSAFAAGETISLSSILDQPGAPVPDHSNNHHKSKGMTIDQLKAEHPALYTQILAAGEQAGIDKERDRVGSFLAFIEADPLAVKEGISAGKAMTETQRSEFAMAAYKVAQNKAQADDNVPPVTPKPAEPEDKGKQVESEIEAALTSRGINFKS
jgi:ATP-dependent Clp protease, protease subunit